MKRLGALMLVLSLGLVSEAATTHNLPSMSPREAKFYVKKGLRREFGDAYRFGQGKRVNHCARVTRVSRRCRAQWGIGDTFYHGRVFVRYEGCGRFVCWDGRYRIKRLNEYCRVTGGSKRECTDRLRGRFRGGHVFNSDPG
jgi:hypothetical protein